MELTKSKLHKILKKYRKLQQQHKDSWEDSQKRIRAASGEVPHINERAYMSESYDYQLKGNRLFQSLMEEFEGYEVFPKKQK